MKRIIRSSLLANVALIVAIGSGWFLALLLVELPWPIALAISLVAALMVASGFVAEWARQKRRK